MDLSFNYDPRFTRWVVANRLLAEPFVLVDVGVQGGESRRRRWHMIGAH